MAKVYTLNPRPAGKIADLAEEYLADLARRNYSAQTVRAYRSALNCLARVFADRDAAQIGTRELAEALARPEWDPDTRAARQAAAKSFFSWLASQGYVEADPARGLLPFRQEEGLPRPIPQDDLARVLAAADRLPLPPRTLVRLLADTALRVGEALALDVEDLVWERGQEAVLVERGKGGRGRSVPLLPDMKCWPLLKRLCRERKAGPLFVTARETRADYDWAYYWWKRALSVAGLAEKGYTIHQLRHTAITGWVARGMNLMAVRRAAGHRNIRTTARYALVADEDLRREMEKVTRGR
ncbi:MAG: tyrosine-type recombinase/integrase [Moorellales bacterium]